MRVIVARTHRSMFRIFHITCHPDSLRRGYSSCIGCQITSERDSNSTLFLHCNSHVHRHISIVKLAWYSKPRTPMSFPILFEIFFHIFNSITHGTQPHDIFNVILRTRIIKLNFIKTGKKSKEGSFRRQNFPLKYKIPHQKKKPSSTHCINDFKWQSRQPFIRALHRILIEMY